MQHDPLVLPVTPPSLVSSANLLRAHSDPLDVLDTSGGSIGL